MDSLGNMYICCTRYYRKTDISRNNYLLMFIKFNVDGSFAWEKEFRTENPIESINPTKIFITKNSDIVVVGFNELAGGGEYTANTWSAKYDSSGNMKWHRYWNPKSFIFKENDFLVEDGVQTKDGGFILLSDVRDTVSYYAPNILKQQCFVFKLDSFGCMNKGCQTLSVDKPLFMEANDISVYPNPANSFCNFFYPNWKSDMKIFINDVLGNTLVVKDINSEKTEIDIGNLSNGVYFYRVENENQLVKSGKMIVQH